MNRRLFLAVARRLPNDGLWVLAAAFQPCSRATALQLHDDAKGPQDEAERSPLTRSTHLQDHCGAPTYAATHNDRVHGSRIVGLLVLTAGKEHCHALDVRHDRSPPKSIAL